VLGEFHVRHKGDVLHEARENAETLEQVRRDIGDDVFAAQYLQRPNARVGAVLNQSWFPRCAEARAKDQYQRRVLSIDTAMTTEMTADYSVCSVFGGEGKVYDLLYVWRDRVEYDTLLAKVEALIQAWKPTHIIIEWASVGIPLCQRLSKRFSTGLIPFHSNMPKEERLARLLNYFQQGHIRLPQAASRMPAFNNEVFSFHGSTHDDQLDTLVQFANKADVDFQCCPPISWAPPTIQRVDELRERYGRYVAW
jgi:predicted phage terminase large subunit-like protein